MVERMAWRRAVEASRLPSGVKLTLLVHSERGPGHFHDEEGNAHGYPQLRLADRLGGANRSTIRRHYRRAEEAGFLVLHEKGSRGQQPSPGRGKQNVFHYVTPTDPWPCEVCDATADRGTTTGVHPAPLSGERQGCAYYPFSAPLSADRDAPPISTPYRSHTADQPDPMTDSPRNQRFSDPSAAAVPAPNPSSETGSGECSTTDRARGHCAGLHRLRESPRPGAVRR